MFLSVPGWAFGSGLASAAWVPWILFRPFTTAVRLIPSHLLNLFSNYEMKLFS